MYRWDFSSSKVGIGPKWRLGLRRSPVQHMGPEYPPTPPGVERVRSRSKHLSCDQQGSRPEQAAAGHCPMQAPACRQASQNRASAGACRLEAPAGRQATRKSSIFLSKGRQEGSYPALPAAEAGAGRGRGWRRPLQAASPSRPASIPESRSTKLKIDV